MARLPADPEGFIRANTALEAPAMVPEFRLWLASEYVPIWQATEAWLEEQNVDPPYWAFCWPGGQAIARYLLDNQALVAGKRVIDFAAGSGVSSLAAARGGAASVVANDIDALSLIAARLNGRANDLSFEVSLDDWLAGPEGAPDADIVIACAAMRASAGWCCWAIPAATISAPRVSKSARAMRSRPRCSWRTEVCVKRWYGGCCPILRQAL